MSNLNTIKKLVNNKFHNADTITVSDYEETNSEVVFSVNTENNITMVSILKGLVEGLKGQRIYVERFIGCDTSTIVIENPVLNTDGYDFQDLFHQTDSMELYDDSAEPHHANSILLPTSLSTDLADHHHCSLVGNPKPQELRLADVLALQYSPDASASQL